MEISIADQIALDDALVAPANRLKIGKCNLRLSSDVTSKEATLQVAYDVLKLTPFYKAFQVSADVPEIYMQEFWASAYVHNRSVRFKMNNKKHILDLDQFRDILQICPKVGNKKFEEPPLEKEILAFLASLGHSGEIRKITDVNVNKLHQPWRSFAAIINKCLNGKTSDGSLHPSIPRRNKVNWHYAKDDPIFTTINVISRNEDTRLYGTILPAELTNEDIRNSKSYKEYYKPPTIPKEKKGKKTGKGKQKAKELETISEAILTEAEQLKIITKRSRKETHSSMFRDDGDDFIHPKLTTHDDDTTHEEETNEDDSFDPTVHTPSHVSSSDDEDSNNEVEGVDVEGEKSDEDATYVEDQGNKADRDTNANFEGRDDVKADVVLP
ncbi:hypothetical protein Tco_0967838 [Tanacetum coccineum]